jgi:hypothetical protein
MTWTGQIPQPGRVILGARLGANDTAALAEVDVVREEGPRLYRLTVGDLFDFQEVCTSDDLERIVQTFDRLIKAPDADTARRLLALGLISPGNP